MNNLEIEEKLKELSDEEYKEFHSNLCPGVDNILGVRIPKLKEYAKELTKKSSINELLSSIENKYYEEIMLKGILIGLDKNSDIQAIIKNIKKFIPLINNWAICDIFCAGLKITKRYKNDIWNLIQEYIKSDKEFEIRFGIVMILDYFIEEEYIEKNFEIFNKTKCDKYYVKMAVAWAISICLIKYYNQTLNFLINNSLERDVHNKSIQKALESYRISDERKNELRKMKR